MIEAKLKGEGIEDEATEEPDRGNVVDLMAALRKSLGQGSEEPEKPARTAKGSESAAKAPKKRAAAAPSTAKPSRKRA